jgi:hypothetical protein
MKKRPNNLGCIDPHGMYPFPPDRMSCPKCQAIRAQAERDRRASAKDKWDVWLEVGSAVALGVIVALLAAAWFLDWKPWW